MRRLKEIFIYREMIVSLVQRELRGRYKGTALGFLWTFINPLLQLLVYTLVFSVIMRSGIDKYYLFLFVALVPWLFLNSALIGGSNCIVTSKDMVKKIYFPRDVLPIAFTTASFINMLLTFLVVFAVLLVTGYGLNPVALLFLIPLMAVEYLLVLGLTFLTSALSVYFIDLRYVFSILAMVWQFLTPVMYSQDMVEGALKNHPNLMTIWNLNPATPLINAYRQILYYKQIPDLTTLTSALILGVIVFLIGWFAYDRLQRGFAEEL